MRAANNAMNARNANNVECPQPAQTFLALVAFLAFVSVLPGCGGVVSTKVVKIALPDAIKKITVPLVNNRSIRFGIEAQFTDTVGQEFRKDGRLQLVNEPESDAKLVLTIERYTLEPSQWSVNGIPVAYRLTMHVSLQLISKKTNEVLMSRDRIGGLSGGVVNYAVSPEGGIVIRTEQEAQREVFEKLSRDIVQVVIYGWEKN